MAQEHVSFVKNKKMRNKALVEEFSKSILRHSVEHELLSEYEDGVYLSPTDSKECDELQIKIKLIDDKLAHYRNQRKKASTRLQMIKRHKNLRDDVLKTVSSNVFNRIPSGLIVEILDTSAREDKDINAMLHRLNAVSDKVCAKKLDFDVSDTDQSIVEDADDIIPKSKRLKRKRKADTIDTDPIEEMMSQNQECDYGDVANAPRC